MLFKKKKEDVKFKTWHGILLVGILVVAIILGFIQRNQVSDKILQQSSIILNQETCQVSGGAWNACASACRGQEKLPCIQICVSQCECESDNQCPFGFSCVDLIEGIGICKS